MAPSGGGKTTLLNLINRTVHMDEGTIEGVPSRIGMVFQENRLCEEYDIITNVMLTMRSTQEAVAQISDEARQILPEECLVRPVSELSGGMKRRCVVLRAMLSGAEFIIMDEPFTGLDEENRKRTAEYILQRLGGRTLLVTTHRMEDVELLGAVKIEI
ncbi:MAG: ATP-binding cassette domain-containing protein [Roseburia sp.]|nr:ATP-binding cassette domain-containing protein [Ruminococcus sp.]MCM1155734.1 ATP-binding cassette domain-containing protein [Roseburia sp.]MCM1244006.1 ATP-binding cassette domain-containing protein [Roseburia sp.]